MPKSTYGGYRFQCNSGLFKMNNYFQKLNSKSKRYAEKYNNSPRLVALKMLGWNLKALLTPILDNGVTPIQPRKIQVHKVKSDHDQEDQNTWTNLNPNCLNIGFTLEGGVGDVLIAAAYIQEFRKQLDSNCQIDVYAHPSKDINAVICDNPAFDNVYIRDVSYGREHLYDLFIKFLIYPKVHIYHKERVVAFSKKLPLYVDVLQKFETEHSFVFENFPRANMLANLFEKKCGKTRIEQPDIDGCLGLNAATPYKIKVKNTGLLKKYKLLDRPYITVHRGIDGNNAFVESTKLWLTDYYNELLKLIKKKYPNIVIVQIGISSSRCVTLDNVDINMVGKTTFNEVAELIRGSVIHIDGEGGFVHLNHFLGGTSAVFFGPTLKEFFGYPENLNFSANVCQNGCEWLTPNWSSKCVMGSSAPKCMVELKPKMVFPAIDDYLKRSSNKVIF